MILTLYSVDSDDKQFINYIIDIAKDYAYANINEKKCKDWDNYLLLYTGRKFDSKDILLKGFDNLIAKYLLEFVQVEVNPIKDYGIDKLSTLCQAICYGTIEMPGYDLFDEAFNYILENIDLLYAQYLIELGDI